MSKLFLDIEKKFMSQAIELAKTARGQTAPNPMVGALVIGPIGEIVGQGFHPRPGEPHAEVFAIREARTKIASLEGCTLYVTLEPCNHFGRTPPCLDLVVTSGIKHVVVGAIDPNPKMKGSSIDALRENGVLVDVGCMKKECEDLIRGFSSVMLKHRPFITLKCATSLDGKIATSRGESQWITDEPARQLGHSERNEHDAILVGVGTVLADDPQLNVRIDGDIVIQRGLTKVILDSTLRTPVNARLLKTAGQVLIYCDWTYSSERRAALEAAGARVIPLSSTDTGFSPEGVDLREVVQDLAKRGVQELLIEGGARVLGTVVKERLFDRVVYFMAPRIFGSASRDVFEGLDIPTLSESVNLENLSTRLIGRDIVIEGTLPCSLA